jgi:hypothetical protein
MTNKKRKTVTKTHALCSQSSKVTKPYDTAQCKTSNPVPVVGSTSSSSTSGQPGDFPSTFTFQATFQQLSSSSSTNVTANISSENSDMLIDPPESGDQQKGQKSSATTGNLPNVCNISFARPEEFTIFADLRTIPGSDHGDKRRTIDFRFKDDVDYVGNRIVMFRGRLIIKVYFLSESSAKAACTPSTSIHESDLRLKISFAIFSKDFIEKDIRSQRDNELPNTL